MGKYPGSSEAEKTYCIGEKIKQLLEHVSAFLSVQCRLFHDFKHFSTFCITLYQLLVLLGYHIAASGIFNIQYSIPI